MAPAHAKSPPKSSPRGHAHIQKRSGASVRNRTITPVIKIVHVFAPTLVQADVANFRALVQEMTGNVATRPSIKDINTSSSTEASTEEKSGAAVTYKRAANAQVCAHREDGASSGAAASCLIMQGGAKEKRAYATARDATCSANEGGGLACEYGEMERSESWGSSCEQSVDSFFAEESEEDHQLCMVQQTYNCSAYFATTSTWRQPLQEMPGGFESFDCY